MNACVVGNGPSALGMGREIDAHGFVVRCGLFSICAAEDTGMKLDAWAWFGALAHPKNMGPKHPGHYVHWVTRAVNPTRPVIPENVVLLYNVIVHADGDPVKVVAERHWQAMRDFLGAQPTTGFIAIGMLIAGYAGLPIDGLTLYGFDCTTMDRPGMTYGGQHRAGCPAILSSGDHDHVAEKKALAALVRDKTWLGLPCHLPAKWVRPPEGLA